MLRLALVLVLLVSAEAAPAAGGDLSRGFEASVLQCSSETHLLSARLCAELTNDSIDAQVSVRAKEIAGFPLGCTAVGAFLEEQRQIAKAASAHLTTAEGNNILDPIDLVTLRHMGYRAILRGLPIDKKRVSASVSIHHRDPLMMFPVRLDIILGSKRSTLVISGDGGVRAARGIVVQSERERTDLRFALSTLDVCKVGGLHFWFTDRERRVWVANSISWTGVRDILDELPVYQGSR